MPLLIANEFGRYVVVHNGRRDDYQVALALSEVGALQQLVTDFYSKTGLVLRRNCAGLPRSEVTNVWSAVAEQAWFRLNARLPIRQRTRDWTFVDRRLGGRAAKLASRGNAGVVAYSGGMALPAFSGVSGPRLLFVFHPFAPLIREILAKDARSFGLSEATLMSELEFSDTELPQKSQAEVRQSNRVIVASSFTARSLSSEWKLSSTPPISVVPYGSPPVAVTVRRTGVPKFLFVGQGVQRKGIHHLATAWQQVNSMMPQAKLTVVTKTIDAGLGVSFPASVQTLGPVSSPELHNLMDSHDVLVLPSLVEGFGLVITEALAHGMHIITTPNTGLPDLPVEPGAATLVPPGDPGALTHCIMRILEGDPLDHEASYASAAAWQWSDFRRGIRSAILDQ